MHFCMDALKINPHRPVVYQAHSGRIGGKDLPLAHGINFKL